MAQRLHSSEDRKLPILNFNLPINVKFSISTTKKLSMDFSTYCGNNDKTCSQKLRGYIYEELGTKNQRDFNKLMVELEIYIKEFIKKRIKEKQGYLGNNWFSTFMEKKIKRDVYSIPEKRKKNEK